jgi:hypothetical protein
MSDKTPANAANTEALLVDQLVDKLFSIDLEELDVEREMIALNKSNDWRFVIIPATVLLLIAGMVIGSYSGAMLLGLLGGAGASFLVGYAYQLWDKQWRDIAVQNILKRIDAIEGNKGFVRWFRPLLARNTYKVMFYKLYKQQVVDIPMYVRALHRLREKPKNIVRAALIATHPELVPPPPPELPEITLEIPDGLAPPGTPAPTVLP